MEEKGKYREQSTIEEEYSEGALFCAWTNKWGLKVYTWYSMDLITFSFIEKGKKGKGKSFDVSIPAKKNYYFDFNDFCHEVLQDIRTPYDFLTVMQQEKENGEKYPKRYRFITGENGEKMVGFCNSNSDGREYCINASITRDNHTTVANMPLSYYDIYELAEAFKKTYEKREAQLHSILLEGIENRDANIREMSARQVKDLSVTTTSKLAEKDNGDYVVDAKTAAGQDITIRLSKDATRRIDDKKNGCFKLFQERINQKPTSFRFSGRIQKKGDTEEYLFEKFEQ